MEELRVHIDTLYSVGGQIQPVLGGGSKQYLAVHIETSTPCTLTIYDCLTPEATTAARAQVEYLRLLNCHEQLNCGILREYSSFYMGNQVYCVTQASENMIDGKTFKTSMNAKLEDPEEDRYEVINHVAPKLLNLVAAVHRMHNSGVLHNNIRPWTVLWDDGLRSFFLTGFESASWASDSDPNGESNDKFALGVTMWMLLTGLDFRTSDWSEQCARLRDRIVVRSKNSAVSILVQTIISLTNPDPSERYSLQSIVSAITKKKLSLLTPAATSVHVRSSMRLDSELNLSRRRDLTNDFVIPDYVQYLDISELSRFPEKIRFPTSLRSLDCHSTDIRVLNASWAHNLVFLDLSRNVQLTTVELHSCPQLEFLNVNYCPGLSVLKGEMPVLKKLLARETRLVELPPLFPNSLRVIDCSSSPGLIAIFAEPATQKKMVDSFPDTIILGVNSFPIDDEEEEAPKSNPSPPVPPQFRREQFETPKQSEPSRKKTQPARESQHKKPKPPRESDIKKPEASAQEGKKPEPSPPVSDRHLPDPVEVKNLEEVYAPAVRKEVMGKTAREIVSLWLNKQLPTQISDEVSRKLVREVMLRMHPDKTLGDKSVPAGQILRVTAIRGQRYRLFGEMKEQLLEQNLFNSKKRLREFDHQLRFY